MSTIHKALYDFILDDDALVDAVRDNARRFVQQRLEDRIYYGTLSQGIDLPALHLAGGSGAVDSGLAQPLPVAQPEITFTLWTRQRESDRTESDEIYGALKSLLHLYRGPLNDDVTADIIRLDAEPFDRSQVSPDDAASWRIKKTFSFFVAHTIAAPAGVN